MIYLLWATVRPEMMKEVCSDWLARADQSPQIEVRIAVNTEEQAKDPGAEFFAAQEQTDCKIKKFDMSGGAINSEMSCSNVGAPGEMNMAMTGQYGPSSYEMTMTMNGGAGGMKMNITAKNNGKRIGSCPAG